MDDRTWQPKLSTAVAVDIVLFSVRDGALSVLLIRRGLEPFRGRWALPGGFVRENETLENAAIRELKEEAGVHDVYLEQFRTYGDPHRDPRARVLSVAYVALVRDDAQVLRASTDADDAAWFTVSSLPKLAFDHAKILADARNFLSQAMSHAPIGFQLLAAEFTLAQLQTVYEAVLGTTLDKRNFRRKILADMLVIPVEGKQEEGAHRPAQLYSYAKAHQENG